MRWMVMVLALVACESVDVAEDPCLLAYEYDYCVQGWNDRAGSDLCDLFRGNPPSYDLGYTLACNAEQLGSVLEPYEATYPLE